MVKLHELAAVCAAAAERPAEEPLEDDSSEDFYQAISLLQDCVLLLDELAEAGKEKRLNARMRKKAGKLSQEVFEFTNSFELGDGITKE